MSVNATQVKEKLEQIYPDINKFGLGLDVGFDQDKNAWIAHFKKGEHILTTHLEPEDVDSCLEGRECYHLGIQLGQFIRNYCEGGQECRL
ncbi:MAG: hypothetical protein ACOCZ2_03055 [Thermodesulfobacteriota bacterium]